MLGFRFEDVHKAFGANQVLAGIHLAVEPGGSLLVIGGSGSGKSVMLRLLLGLLRPDRGRVFLGDAEVSSLSEEALAPVRMRVGMLFQGGALFDSMSVTENIAFPMREHGVLSDAQIKERVERTLNEVGLPGIGVRAPAELSGGMRKRVALARAIVQDPDVILYDEPTTGLDPANATRISMLIRDLHRKLGCTQCVVTHDMACARIVGGRFAFLAHGAIVVEGPLEAIEEIQREELSSFLDYRGGLV